MQRTSRNSFYGKGGSDGVCDRCDMERLGADLCGVI